MRLAVGLAVATGLEIGSFLALPPGGEANPVIVGLGPILSVAAKVVCGLALAAYARSSIRYGRAVAVFGIAAWMFGAATNVATII